MNRRTEQIAPEEDGPIILTAQDVLAAPHGECPCRVAATLLQHFVNQPEQFFDKLLDRQMSFQPEYSDYHRASSDAPITS